MATFRPAACVIVVALGCGRIGFEADGSEPTLDIDFTIETLPPGLVLSRDSPAMYVDAKGVLRLAGNDMPRFDHDPLTGLSLGLLIESSAANLARASQQLDVPNPNGWFSNGSSRIEPDTGLAPDGTMTADRFVDEDTVNTRRAISVLIPDDNLPYAFSLFVKAETLTRISFSGELLGGDQVQPTFSVDLSTGEIVQPPNDMVVGIGAIPFADGWFRVWLTVQNNSTGNDLALLSLWSDWTDGSSQGSVFAWGAQIEQALAPSSYVPALVGPSSRAADRLVMRDVDRLDPTTGSVRMAARATSLHSSPQTAVCLTGDGTDSMCLVRGLPPESPTLSIVTDGAEQTRLSGDAWRDPRPRVVAWAYATDDVALSDEGNALIFDRSVTLSAAYTSVTFGSDASGGSTLAGHLVRFMYFPNRLTDQSLQALASAGDR